MGNGTLRYMQELNSHPVERSFDMHDVELGSRAAFTIYFVGVKICFNILCRACLLGKYSDHRLLRHCQRDDVFFALLR